jgi:hypothetical protein
MNRNIRIAIYAIAAAAALYGTWSQNLQYGAGLGGFFTDMKASPAARSITIDIALMALSASFLMVYEARRLGVRFVWAYIFFGITVAISFTFPLFLIAREFALDRNGEAAKPVGIAAYDYAGLLLVTGFISGIYWFTLFA